VTSASPALRGERRSGGDEFDHVRFLGPDVLPVLEENDFVDLIK
jgi:hypothetical protein